MKIDREGVHITHCCKKHGCKYFDPDCPVVNGRAEARYKCEDCESDREHLKSLLEEMSLLELLELYKEKLQGSGNRTT